MRKELNNWQKYCFQSILFCLCLIYGFIGNVSAQERVALQPETGIAMTSDAEVTVSTVTVPEWTDLADPAVPDYYYAFTPTAAAPTEALILYPGALVDPQVYAVAAHQIARAGYLVVIISVPNDLAMFGVKRADDVIDDYPGMSTWSIGGHSLGGVAACTYTKNVKFFNPAASGNYLHADDISGVVLWASYPSVDFRLDGVDVDVTSISGSEDNMTTPQKIEDNKPFLPADTLYVEIEGANHTQFGYYGDNASDHDFVQRVLNQGIRMITRRQFHGKNRPMPLYVIPLLFLGHSLLLFLLILKP